MTEEYVPSVIDTTWAKNLVACLKDGGVWHVPATLSMYTIDKKAKTLTLSLTGDPEDASQIHQRSKIVFEKIGYKVIEEA